MNRIPLYGLIAAASLLAMPALAETYMLNHGKEVEGVVIRTEGPKITLKTKSGIMTYHVKEFTEDTRLTHFKDVPLAVIPKAQTRTPWYVAFFQKLPHASITILVVGIVMISGGGIWMTMAAYDVSPNWGLALVMSGGSAELAFMFKHWDRACWPLMTQACGIAVCISAVMLGG